MVGLRGKREEVLVLKKEGDGGGKRKKDRWQVARENKKKGGTNISGRKG